jgi:hypothetical protein
MDIARLITFCRESGIDFCLGSGTVKVRGIASVVEELLPLLREHKNEIIEYLSFETIQTCGKYALYHERNCFISKTMTEIARMETVALLERLMSQRV